MNATLMTPRALELEFSQLRCNTPEELFQKLGIRPMSKAEVAACRQSAVDALRAQLNRFDRFLSYARPVMTGFHHQCLIGFFSIILTFVCLGLMIEDRDFPGQGAIGLVGLCLGLYLLCGFFRLTHDQIFGPWDLADYHAFARTQQVPPLADFLARQIDQSLTAQHRLRVSYLGTDPGLVLQCEGVEYTLAWWNESDVTIGSRQM